MIRRLAPLGAFALFALAAPLAAQESAPSHAEASRPEAPAEAPAAAGAPGIAAPREVTAAPATDVIEREAFVMGTRLGARVAGTDAAAAVEAAFETARTVG